MSKKDYIKFAAMLKVERENLESHLANDKSQTALNVTCAKYAEHKELTLKIANIFSEDNPNFNREKFFHAVGYGNSN